MANETVQSMISDLTAIAVAEARLTMENQTDLTSLITRRDLSPGQISARFPKWSSLTAAALSEGSAAANQAMAAAGNTLTPTTNAVVRSTITDITSFSAPQIAADFGRIAGSAIVKKKNSDVWALFDGFSTAVGTGNTDIAEATILTGVKKLRQANAVGDIYLAVTPEVMEDLFTVYSTNTNNTTDGLRNAVMAGEMPSIYGVRVVLVTSGITETGDIKCGMFTKEALGYAVSWDIKMEMIRVPSVVGFEIVASSCYAVGEIDDSLGVEVLVDGTD